jgi:CxxC motif-containing protein (DUF1111 family)
MNRPGLGALAALALVACGSSSEQLGFTEGEELPGGEATTRSDSQDAFTQPAPNLSQEQVGTFQAGNIFNGTTWIVAPASVSSRDGLGPLYNATSCSSCHLRDGRGRPPAAGEDMLSMLVRLSVPGTDEHGGPKPEPHYGGQLQPRAILGVPPEALAKVSWKEVPGKYADGSAYSLRSPTLTITDLAYGPLHEDTMFSVRIAAQQYGLGLLETVSEADVLAHADADDVDGDGISGRPNYVWDAVAGKKALGRIGWKANQPSVRQQTAGALNGDIGMTTSIFSDKDCAPGQEACASAPSGGAPEVSKEIFEAMVFYGRTLAVPARKSYRDKQVLRGRELFRSAGCADCHVPSFTTAKSDIAALSHQQIWPYTDMLLHDMGDELADHRPDYEATGNEWRTSPLWGISLLETVQGFSFFLHDGRARDLAEAILWHGGEAEAAREAFRSMSKEERAALIAFVKSL